MVHDASSRVRYAPVLGWLLLLAFEHQPASAEEPARAPFSVEYSEGSVCTNAESFSEKLLQRTDRLRRANGSERALVFHIGIAPNGEALTGRISMRELDGSQTARDVPGATCEEVTSAMALIAAVLVDPNASAEPLPEPAPEPATPPPLPLESAPAGSIANPRPPDPAPPQKPLASTPTPSRFTFGGGAAFALEGAIGPGVTPALSLELEAAFERGELLSPLLVVAFERAFPTRSETPNGVARLQWTTGRASGCPVRFPTSGPFALRPCALFEYGALAASGEQTERRASVSTTWSALGGTLRGEYSPLGPLLIMLDGGFVV
ncbi:MAG TPA: hypothetical protein VF103_03300, partial [Polyangiaceae bacterium]